MFRANRHNLPGKRSAQAVPHIQRACARPRLTAIGGSEMFRCFTNPKGLFLLGLVTVGAVYLVV